MSVGGLVQQSLQEKHAGDGEVKKKSSLWYRRSLRGSSGRQQHDAASLSRVHKPKQHPPSSSLVDYSDPQRTSVVLEKQDNETFGFEIQTYGLQLRSSSAVEMYTFVCRVEEDGAAENAGLTAGDVIVTINGSSIEGSTHQHVLDLIRRSTNRLKMETVCGSVVKWIELEKRLNRLQQTLGEKVMELRALSLQEQRLTGGTFPGGVELPDALISPTGRCGRRFSSDSSCRSVMTDDSDQASVFGDVSSPSPFSAAGEDVCFFARELPLQPSSRSRFSSSSSFRHPSLSHSVSSGSAASGSNSSSSSPTWDERRISSLFGTLPRKGRRGERSVRKNILKLIPGLQRSVEEEETDTEVVDHTKGS